MPRRSNKTPWSDEEIDTLLNNYPKAALARHVEPLLPGRSLVQIRSQAAYYGIKRAPVGPQEPLPISPTQAAYLAGLIDGEGTITVNLYRSTRQGRHPALVPWVGVFNTDPTLLEWLTATTGLAHLHRMRKNPTKNAKMVYEWKVKAVADVARLLKTILPYLVIKRRQAELVLAFCENRVMYSSPTEAEFAILDEIRTLNKRGTA